MRIASPGPGYRWRDPYRMNWCARTTIPAIMPAIGSLETSLDYPGASTRRTDRHSRYDESGETADEFIEELFSDHLPKSVIYDSFVVPVLKKDL